MGYVSTRPICGPLLIWSPAPKRWGLLKRQGLCSHPACLWETADFVPRFEALGTPQASHVMYPTGPVAGIPAATPSKPHANILKVVTYHRRSTFVDSCKCHCQRLPRLARLPFLGMPLNPSHGCGRRAKRCIWHMPFSMIVMPCFFTNGIPTKKRRLERTTHEGVSGRGWCCSGRVESHGVQD